MSVRPAASFRLPFAIAEGYNPTVDYLRLSAAIVIVQFHASATLAPMGEGAVGFFVIVMVWFTLRSALTLTHPLRYLSERARRLLRPFAVWTVILLASKIADGLLRGDPAGNIVHFLPPNGSFAQLWFLPWALLVTAALVAVQPLWAHPVTTGAGMLRGVVAVTLGAAVLLAVWMQDDLALILRLCALYSVSVLAGVLLFRLRADGLLMVAAAAGLCAGGIALRLCGFEGTQQMVAAPPLLVAALMIRLPEAGWTRRLPVLSMDIFLAHTAVIAVVGLALPYGSAGAGIAAVVGSIAVALVLQAAPFGRWLR